MTTETPDPHRRDYKQHLATALETLCIVIGVGIATLIISELVFAGKRFTHGQDPLDGSLLVKIGSWVELLIVRLGGV